MKISLVVVFLMGCVFALSASAGQNFVSGKITALMGSGTEPAIIIDLDKVPTGCYGGTYHWLFFAGTAEERQWIYSTALAMAVTGKTVSVYTNSDGTTCRINNIQITTGLN